MTSSDVEFYKPRAEAERERVETAASSCARQVHQRLAQLDAERRRHARGFERSAARRVLKADQSSVLEAQIIGAGSGRKSTHFRPFTICY